MSFMFEPMVVTSPSQRQLIKKFSVRPRKSLGQNFIIKEEILDKIVQMCHLHQEDTVVEIGAGLGGLTSRLAVCVKMVLAIEKDKKLAYLLKTHIIKQHNVKIIQQDALRFDYQLAASIAGSPLKIVGNLPYTIASPLTIELLKTKNCINEMVLMYQKEVADRMTSQPGSKNYGFLTIMVNLYADIEPLFTLGKESFYPRPKVESTLIHFNVLSQPRENLINERYFTLVVKSAFSQRRKKLRNALRLIKGAELSSDIIEKVCREIDVDPNRRGETLNLKEFTLLSNHLLLVLSKGDNASMI